MARAAQGASPAFFKLIRTGGCSSREQLASQFSYLFSKSVDIHDSKGLLDHTKTLTPEQIDRAVARWADDWKGKLNAARTTHMVMSFPRGANPRHVSLIAGEICREKLGGRFDYMIAVHTDSPNKNPHAHIIVNRRGGQGDYFALRRGTEYTYETFKEAMVDHAKRYGIQLEATTRLQRGHVNYPPTDGQWRRAKEKAADTGQAFEAPAGKPRVGAALARATDEIRDWSLRYRDLSSFASASNMQDLATAFEKAAQVLAKGGVILAKGEPYMTVEEDFDRAAADLKNAVDRAERSISEAGPNQRPAMERQLAEALASVEHLQPLGARSRDLSDIASNDGIYSAQNVEAIHSRLAVEGRDKLSAALDGTGIDPVEVEARMRVGANSAALEARWTQQDVQYVAEMRGLDLRDEAQMQLALEVVNAAHNRIAQDYGIDDAIERRAASAEAGTDAIADYEARFPDGDTRLADEISADARRAQEQEDAELDAATDAMIQMKREEQELRANSGEVQIPVITGDGERLEMTEAQIRTAAEHDAELRLESPVDENDLVPSEENIAALREYHEQQRRENAIDYDAHGDPDYLGEQAEAQFNRQDTADQMARSREADTRQVLDEVFGDETANRNRSDDTSKAVAVLEALRSSYAAGQGARFATAADANAAMAEVDGAYGRGAWDRLRKGDTTDLIEDFNKSQGQRFQVVSAVQIASANASRELGHNMDTREQIARSREADAREHAPTTSIGSTEAARHELRQYANPVGADDDRRLREAVERALTRHEIERLKRGDVDGLKGVGSREEQLAMARDYLRSTNDPTAQQGLDRVNEQLAAEREQQRRERGHEGGGHE